MLFGVIAALLWAATTVLIRATGLARGQRGQDAVLPARGIGAGAARWRRSLMGEPGVVALTPLALASLAYQGVIVAFASYLAWFWLLTRYLAGRLAVFSFLTPLFGVLFGVLILSRAALTRRSSARRCWSARASCW